MSWRLLRNTSVNRHFLSQKAPRCCQPTLLSSAAAAHTWANAASEAAEPRCTCVLGDENYRGLLAGRHGGGGVEPGRMSHGISTWSGDSDPSRTPHGSKPGGEGARTGTEDPLQTLTSSSFLELLETSTHSFWHALSKRRPVSSDFASINEEYSWSFLEESGFEAYEIESMQYRCPGLLELSVESTMEPALMYLRSLRLPPDSLHAMVYEVPKLLALDAADEMEPVVTGLTDAGLSWDELPRLLRSSPRLLVDGPAGLHNLRLVALERLGLPWQEAAPVLREAMLLGRGSVEAAALLELLGSLGLEPGTLGSVTRTHPWVAALTVAGVEDRVRLLERHGLTRPDVGRLIAFAPALLLGSSAEKFAPRAAMLARLARLSGWLPAESCPPSWRTYWAHLFRAQTAAPVQPRGLP